MMNTFTFLFFARKLYDTLAKHRVRAKAKLKFNNIYLRVNRLQVTTHSLHIHVLRFTVKDVYNRYIRYN